MPRKKKTAKGKERDGSVPRGRGNPDADLMPMVMVIRGKEEV